MTPVQYWQVAFLLARLKLVWESNQSLVLFAVENSLSVTATGVRADSGANKRNFTAPSSVCQRDSPSRAGGGVGRRRCSRFDVLSGRIWIVRLAGEARRGEIRSLRAGADALATDDPANLCP